MSNAKGKSKNKKWDYDIKVQVVKEMLDGASYQYVKRKYNISSDGMLFNWKKAYLDGTLSKVDGRGRKKQEFDDVEALKKCSAQLMEIRSKQQIQKNILSSID